LAKDAACDGVSATDRILLRIVVDRVISKREKLPKTMSYPATTSVMKDALAATGVDIETHLIFSRSRIFLDAHFWPPNANIPHERLYIRVGTVPASEARDARAFMSKQAIPALLEWLGALVVLPARSPRRQAEQYFRQEWDGPESPQR
jgi:hypothetical protein